MTELDGLSFWDPLAAAALIDPAIIRTRTATMIVDASNGALREAAGGTTVRVAGPGETTAGHGTAVTPPNPRGPRPPRAVCRLG